MPDRKKAGKKPNKVVQKREIPTPIKSGPKKVEEIEEVKKSLFEEKETPQVPPTQHQTPPVVHSPIKNDEKPHSADSASVATPAKEAASRGEQEEVEVADVKVEETSSSTIKNLIPAGVGFIIGIITTALFMYYYDLQTRKAEQSLQVTPTVTALPTPTKTATDSASLVTDMALYDITVLNGSGKGGEAGKLEKKLKSEGFAVFEIGNADKSDYTKTIIKAKNKVPGTFLEKLKSFLKTQFELEEKIETLAESEKTEVVIIVGSNPSSQNTPSATVTPKPTP